MYVCIKMGRAKVYKKGREQLTIYLNPDEFEEFEKIRWRERQDATKLGRAAILEYIKAHAEGNSTFKLDKWHEDPEFQAVPTFKADIEVWKKYYEDSNQKEKTTLRIKATNLLKKFRQVDINS